MKSVTLKSISIFSIVIGLFAGSVFAASTGPAGNRTEQELTGAGWYAWLDKNVQWQNETVYPNNFTVATLPINAPTGGWAGLFGNPIPWQNVGHTTSATLQVSVPGTVEEYFWNAITSDGKGAGTNGNYQGVSWWGRDFTVTGSTGKKVMLWVENARLRCEVYVNQKLVGYDCVGNLPFESDITPALVSGTNKLALRITDPGGNFDWGDFNPPISWGNQRVCTSHGFGGIMGRVKIIMEDSVAVKDIFVKNKPTITDVDVSVTLANKGAAAWSGSIALDVMTTDSVPVSVYTTAVTGLNCNAGDTTIVTKTISVPTAKIWDVGKGNLYNLRAVLSSGSGTAGDGYVQRFGFRWFEVANAVTNGNQRANTMYRLNGKRIVLKSAISWGFFPANGMYATADIAAAQVAAAQSMGLNMLNFHRCIGQTIIFDVADEKGLLYYEEPGAYTSYYGYLTDSGYTNSTLPRTNWNEFGLGRQMAREKVLRMVRRDRSHPALIQYNLANEYGPPQIDESKQDIHDMHALDPNRLISFSSGFMGEGGTAANKLHYLPNDTNAYNFGYCDIHNSGGVPGSYLDSCYQGPGNYYRDSHDTNEVMLWGEENALAALPRLQKLYDYYSNANNPQGWDGGDYVDWYTNFKNYLTTKGLTQFYPSFDSLTLSTGSVTYYMQGRLIENTRINDVSDGYVINGWECEKLENHSGVVDQLRNFKGDLTLITDYTRPLYVAVKAREKIGNAGDSIIVDLYVVNENALAAGAYTLTLQSNRPDNTVEQLYNANVNITGGDRFGELLAQNIVVHLAAAKAGYYLLKAGLWNKSTQVADGHEEILSVNWKSMTLSASGALASTSAALTNFLANDKKLSLPTFQTSQGVLKYVIAGPPGGQFSSDSLLRRVNTDGTNLIIVDSVSQWMAILKSKSIIPDYSTLVHGTDWDGGGFLVRRSSLFSGLPFNCAMNWEYQDFDHYHDHVNFGFQTTGEIPVVSDWSNHDHRLCTAVGIISYGKGKILFSSLNITQCLPRTNGPANVPKKVFCNFIAWGSGDTTMDSLTSIASGMGSLAMQFQNAEYNRIQAMNQTGTPAGTSFSALGNATIAAASPVSAVADLSTSRSTVTAAGANADNGAHVATNMIFQGADMELYDGDVRQPVAQLKSITIASPGAPVDATDTSHRAGILVIGRALLQGKGAQGAQSAQNDIHVMLFSDTTRSPVAEMMTDSLGNYVLSISDTGSYLLRCEPPLARWTEYAIFQTPVSITAYDSVHVSTASLMGIE